MNTPSKKLFLATILAGSSLVANAENVPPDPLAFLKESQRSYSSNQNECIQQCRDDYFSCLQSQPSGPLGTEICDIRWDYCVNRCGTNGGNPGYGGGL